MGVVILPEDPADEWDLSAWMELMGNTRPGGSGAFSPQMSEDVLAITVPFNQVRSCIRQLLGYAWADDASPWQLHREAVPVQHPQLPWLWADSVAVTPKNPLPAEATNADKTHVKVDAVNFATYGPDYFGRYSYAEVAVRFRPVYYRVWRDSDPIWQDTYAGKEYMRNFGCVGKQMGLDLIVADGGTDSGSLVFAEGKTGGVGTGPATGPGGRAIPGAVYFRQNRNKFKMIWKQVPVNFVCGEMLFDTAHVSTFLMPLAPKFAAAIGKVNSLPFPGSSSPHLAGTLLLTEVEEIPYQQPVRTDSEFGLWACDVVFTMEHYNPDRDSGAHTNPDPITPVKYGHHLQPYRPTGYSYYATYGDGTTRGTYNGKSPLGEYDFHSLFTHKNA